MLDLIFTKYRTKVLLAGGATALALAFGAGWQVNGWRLSTVLEQERTEVALARVELLEQHVGQMEAEARTNQALETELVALRSAYTTLQEKMNALPDDGTCALDIDRVRLLGEIGKPLED